jgi:hypothetical protein
MLSGSSRSLDRLMPRLPDTTATSTLTMARRLATASRVPGQGAPRKLCSTASRPATRLPCGYRCGATSGLTISNQMPWAAEFAAFGKGGRVELRVG